MKKYLPRYPDCFVCGDKNAIGLKRRFYVELDETGDVIGDAVFSDITFTKKYVGFKGIVHGGIITALIDETMWWAAVVKTKESFVTADLSVSFLRPISTGVKLTFKGKFVNRSKKLVVCDGVVVDSSGVALVKAKGRFFVMDEADRIKVMKYLAFDEDTYNII